MSIISSVIFANLQIASSMDKKPIEADDACMKTHEIWVIRGKETFDCRGHYYPNIAFGLKEIL